MTNAFLTQTGKAKEAAALANGTTINVAAIAFGSSDRFPTGGETELTQEVYRGLVSSSGIMDGSPNEAFFGMIVPEDGNDEGVDYGPWFAQEVGLFDDDGDLIAVGRLPSPLPKYDPAEAPGAIDFVMSVIFSDIKAINISYTPLQNLPWASEGQAEDDTVENRIIDPKRLWHVLGKRVMRVATSTTFTIDPNGGEDFLNVAEALAWLKNVWIDTGVTVTMQFSAGDHDVSGAVFDAPFLENVLWRGQALTAIVPTYADFNPTNTDGADISRADGEAMLRLIWPTVLTCSTGSAVNIADLRLLNLLFVGGGATKKWSGLVNGLPEHGGKDAQLWLQNVHFHGFGQNGLSVRRGTLRATSYFGASRCANAGLLFANGSVYQGSAVVLSATSGNCVEVIDGSNVEFTGTLVARGSLGIGSLDGCIVASGSSRCIARNADVRFAVKAQASASDGAWLDIRYGKTSGHAGGHSVFVHNGGRADVRDQQTIGATLNIAANTLDAFGSIIRSNGL